MKKDVLIFIALITSIVPAHAWASPVIVEGRRENTPSSHETISLTDEDRQIKSVGEILESRVGVQISRSGSDGSWSSIYIRGTNANQMTIYIDGIPLTDSVYGEVNFENIPISAIDRIEIYRSFAPLSFSSQGIGGVINLITKKERAKNETGIAGAAGSFSRYGFSAFHYTGGDYGRIFFSGSAVESKGDFPFYNDNGTKFNQNDDFSDRRKNNRFSQGDTNVRYSLKTDKAAIDAASSLYAKKQELASYNNTAGNAVLSTFRNMNTVRIASPAADTTPLTGSLSIFANIRRDIFNDLKNELGLFAEKNTGTYTGIGIASYAEYACADSSMIPAASLQIQNEYYKTEKKSLLTTTEYPLQKRTTCNGGIENECSLFDKKLIITPRIRGSLRYDTMTDRVKSAIISADPQIGAFMWLIKNSMYVKSSYGTYTRAPTFAELFGNRGTIRGNPSLKDERSENLDAAAGLSYNDFSQTIIQSFNIEYAFFRTRIHNIIFFMQNSQYTMIAQNISAADITGHEITVSSTVLDHAELSLNGTMQFAKDRSDIAYYRGNYLPHRPILEGSAGLKLFNRYGSLAYEYSYTGANFRDRANSEPLYVEKRIYHSMTASYYPMHNLTLSFKAKNIFGVTTRDIEGYPLPGRSFSASIQYIL